MATQTNQAPGLNKLFQQTDVLLSIGVVLIVVMMIVPLSTGLLDALLVLNIALSLTILVVSLYVMEPAQFSTFPSILLLATLFRLALNISTTRLILLNGDAGHVVAAFGNFVIGGNYAVGIVIFLIIMVIQFVVITNGAGRIAEVTARFTLDAMPGKQMAIDADLNAGMIDENEARSRRKKIRQEADFYGTMDGAAKFVKGDAIAALVMVAVNILGGFAIGVLQRHVDIFQALQTYTLLSIGDGLVSQIPALMISTGTGLLVSRAASEVNLGENIGAQFVASPKALAIVAGTLLLMGLVPALPKIPFFLVGGALAYGYFFFTKRQKEQAEQERTVETVGPEAPKGPENVLGLLQIDPIELEIGYRLIPLVDATQGGDLLERIALIRRQTALKLGLVLPAIRVRDNLQLRPKDYRINLRGIEIARSEVHVDHFMAMSPGLATEQLDGIPAIEPVFGLPAVWISENQKDYAEMLGYTVFDSSAVISTHLTEVIKNHAHEILGRQDVQLLIDNIKKDHPTVIEELIPDILSVGDVQRILQNLLRERVSIRDLLPVLEQLATYAKVTKDVDTLTEYSRLALARAICKSFLSQEGNLPVLTVDPRLEQLLAESIQLSDQGAFLSLDPGVAQKVVKSAGDHLDRLLAQGQQPVVLCSSKVRLVLRRLLERKLPNLAVISYNEVVPPQVEVHALGILTG